MGILFHKHKELPDSLKEITTEAFYKIDANKNSLITFEECIVFWEKNFPFINTQKMISQMDKNQDGVIEVEEWNDFWTYLYNNGYNDDMILAELDKIIKHKRYSIKKVDW